MIKAADVAGKDLVGLARRDNGANEGGRADAVHSDQPGAVESQRQAQASPEHAQALFGACQPRAAARRQQLQHKCGDALVEAREVLYSEGEWDYLRDAVELGQAAHAQEQHADLDACP
jgi:hypothetical protein